MKLKFESAKFNNPSLEMIAESLEKGLKDNYQESTVEIVNCPNLREWGCPSEGISGNERIIDVGGEPYMHDKQLIGTEFDYAEISKKIGSEKSYALGAGSGAMSCLDGHCGELVINENLITNESRSIIAQVNKNKECVTKKYTEKKHGGLSNIYFSDGKIGKVIKIKLKKRIGKQGSLPQAMRTALLENIITQKSEHVALGGVFRVLHGGVKSHVQPLNMSIMIQNLCDVLKIFCSFMNLLDQNYNVTQFYGLEIQRVEISI